MAERIPNATCKCGFAGLARIEDPCSKFQQAQTDENWNEADCVECGHWQACHVSSASAQTVIAMGELHRSDCDCERCARVRSRELDAARYRWLRERIELRRLETLAGTRRPGMAFRISGNLFGVSMQRPNDKAGELDVAIDAEIGAQTVSSSATGDA